MNARILRKKVPKNYFEQEEPAFDEYIYCEKCADFVYEYCSIHGPLLVIPDDKVRNKPEKLSIVPRAALTIPRVFLHLAVSSIPGAGLGVFSTLTLPKGVRFGPYKGRKVKEADSNYCWQVYDKDHKPSHIVDAVDSSSSNWMRYVNCARHWREQNLVAFQYRGELYYRTIKIIPKYTELLVYYGSKYAHELQIDISKYNCENYYYEVLDKQPINIPTVHTVEICPYKEIPSAINKEFQINNNLQDCIKDNFQYMEEASPNEVFTLQFSDNNEYFISTQLENEEIAYTNADEEMKDVQNHLNIDNSHTNGTEQNSIKQENEFKTDTTELKDNFNLETEQILYECDICYKYKTTIKTNFFRHKQIHGVDKLYKCHVCEFQTNFQYIYDRHVRLHTEKYEYHCDKCLYATNHRNYLTRHVTKVHNTEKKMVVCTKCPYKCSNDFVIQSHMRRHDKNLLKCHICHYIARSISSLKQHINKHKQEKSVQID